MTRTQPTGVAVNKEQVLRIYDEGYSDLYDESFLLGPNFAECTAHEIGLLGGLLKTARSWLDVACGTGYFLVWRDAGWTFLRPCCLTLGEPIAGSRWLSGTIGKRSPNGVDDGS